MAALPVAVSVLPYATLDLVREAIRSRRTLMFQYQKSSIRVEPHLLGHARRSNAFILCGWRIDSEPGWEIFRYAEMRDVELLDEYFTGSREGYNPYDRRIAGVDTCVRAVS